MPKLPQRPVLRQYYRHLGWRRWWRYYFQWFVVISRTSTPAVEKEARISRNRVWRTIIYIHAVVFRSRGTGIHSCRINKRERVIRYIAVRIPALRVEQVRSGIPRVWAIEPS